MKRNVFSLATARVAPSGSDFDFEVPEAWLEVELADCDVTSRKPGTFACNVTPVSSGYYVTGRIRVHLGATCVRCLRTAALDLHVPFKVQMNPGPPIERDDEQSVGEDGSLGIGHFQGEEIVLDSLVRESLVLALPMNPRCPDGCTIEDLYRDDD